MPVDSTTTRILIAANCFADADAAIRLADRILTTPPGELGGVLVDEDHLANIVRLPKQRVVTTAGSMVVPPSVQQVEALCEGDARAFERSLATIAQTRATNWSFERRRGDLMRVVLESTEHWDVLLLGHRDMHRRHGQIVAITDQGPDFSRTAQLASDLARALNTSVLTLSLSKETGEDARTQRSRIASDAVPKVISQLGRINASAVVVDLADFPDREDSLRQLLDAARCPVVMLGANQRERLIEIGKGRQSSPASSKTRQFE